MIIFYTHKGYPEKRNFLNSKLIYRQSLDFFKLYTHFSFKLFKYIPQWALNLYYHPFKRKDSIIHYFNGINLGKQKWISTFETFLPRLGNISFPIINLAVKRMASNNCKKLIALSECTYNIQKKYLLSYYPQYSELILRKMIVLHPPQAPLVDSSIKIMDLGLVFTFVGNEFFRKGGREVLQVFKVFHEKGYVFRLNIISNCSPDEYASNTTSLDVTNLKIYLNNLPSSIKFLGSIPNDQVIELFKESHVALLPTYADTYGYFVLEAQACGCPVITTDIRALPEINNESCGWLITVPKDENGNGLLRNSEERIQFSQIVQKSLYKIVEDILNNPLIIPTKGEAALSRIKNDHDPKKHSERLLSIYREISIE
jgi:glycosyltransferase involved in cell wall biosynthesis